MQSVTSVRFRWPLQKKNCSYFSVVLNSIISWMMMICKHFQLFYPEGIMLPRDAQHKICHNTKELIGKHFKVTTEVLRKMHSFDYLVFYKGKRCVAHGSSAAISQVCATVNMKWFSSEKEKHTDWHTRLNQFLQLGQNKDKGSLCVPLICLSWI